MKFDGPHMQLLDAALSAIALQERGVLLNVTLDTLNVTLGRF